VNPLLAASILRAGCLIVEGEHIEARHLAPRAPLGQVPPDTIFGFAPRFGARRHIFGHELAAFARRYGQTLDRAPDVCVERPSHAYQPHELEAALRREAGDGASLELLDYPKQRLPIGTLVFPVSRLTQISPEQPFYWRGFIRQEDGREYPIWARVRAWKTQDVVVTRQRLEQGTRIAAEHLAVEIRKTPLRGEQPLATIDPALGREASRAIQAGEALVASRLLAAREIVRGDRVQVEANAGAARLTVEAIAETTGRRGSRVLLRNPASLRRFHAIVSGPRRAVAEVQDLTASGDSAAASRAPAHAEPGIGGPNANPQ
jgi:flagella basal body P-ring formation protein FlgA